MKLNLPQTVTAADLARLAAPDEQFAVRVIFRRIVNTGSYTIRGAKRRYIATRDPSVAAHVLDVPLSVWMAGAPSGTYVENLSIAHDLQANRIPIKAPLVILVIPWKGAAQKTAEKEVKAAISAIAEFQIEPGPIEAFRTLAETLNAPEVILSAIELLASDLPAEEKEAALAETTATVREQIAKADMAELQNRPRQSEASHSASPPSEKPAPKSNAQRQKELRQRKKAEKEAAKLQTADA